jgi:HK97 family phage major capsid protein
MEKNNMDMDILKNAIGDLKTAIEKRNKAFEDFKYSNDMRMEVLEKELSLLGAKGINQGGGFSSSGFRNFGEFCQSVAFASRPGGKLDDRLTRIQNAASGANETLPAEGGFLVGQDLRNDLLKSIFSVGEVAKRCNRIPISNNSNGIKLNLIDETSRANGSRWGGVQCYWAAEADTVTASKPKFRQANLELKKLFGLCYVTEELLSDASALNQVLTQAFTEEMGFKLEDAIVNGGAGMPLGILNAGCTVSQAIETGQVRATDPLLFKNMVNMWSRMPARNRKNAVWLVNQELESSIYSMNIPVGTGGVPVFLPAGNASSEPFSTFFGRPIIPIEQCAAPGTTGDIILADLTEYILIDKGGIKQDASIHVRFVYDEMCFRWVYRVDGQPALNKPISPFKGSSDLSPFVVLASE